MKIWVLKRYPPFDNEYIAEVFKNKPSISDLTEYAYITGDMANKLIDGDYAESEVYGTYELFSMNVVKN